MEQTHIVKKFDKNLARLKAVILEMGELVVSQFEDATELWTTYEADEVTRILAFDRRVNGFHRDIHQRAEILIVRRQPMAMDLRKTLAPINIAGELERIGDYAKSVAKRAHLFQENRPDEALMDMISQMSDLIRTMLVDILQAYEGSDLELATKVRDLDDEIDKLNKSLRKAVIQALTDLAGNKEMAEKLVQLVLISRNLERVGDHIVNISRFVHQIETGDDLKAFE